MGLVWPFTIRHTGTNFLFANLRQMGFEQIGETFVETVRNNGSLDFYHQHLDIKHNFNLVGDDPVIITMRNPINVYRSHVWRGRIKANPEWYERIMLKSFHDIDGLMKFFNSYLFQVDADDKRDEAECLSRWLGVKDWNYKEQDATANTAMNVPNTMNVKAQALYDNPPNSIKELANQYGY